MTAPTILLVEDNPITTKLVHLALEPERYVVIDASDGAAAVAAFREHAPALVLVDMVLPDCDGFELLQRLRALPGAAAVPMLAFSGMVSKQDEPRLAEVGFDDVVTKPVEPARLLQIIRGHLPSQDASPEPVRRSASARVLVLADDDAVQRKLVAVRLQRAGFEVRPAVDGQDALEQARRARPYAIVSDVLMPNLDGFGLCMAVRGDPELAATPLVLISNSYLEADDKRLAERAGADALLVRTPELRDVIALLHSDAISVRSARPAPAAHAAEPEIERERIRRMMHQLEKQAGLHAGLAQRCALLSAELSVLSGISEAVATQDDIEHALGQILASCFDAGGISIGTLYIAYPEGLRGMRFGMVESWSASDVETFFGHRAFLEAAIAAQRTVCIPSEAHPESAHAELLARTGARSLVVAPLRHKTQQLGALVTLSLALDFQAPDRVAFVQAVAGQISLALALARSFQAKDASERGARANANVLRSILDSMAEGVIVSDETGAVTHWNAAAASILRVSEREISPLALDRNVPLSRALRGEAIDREEVRIQREGHHDELWLSVNGRPLGDDARGGVAVFRDVTSERAANARMLVHERMASLGTLAAGVGHEINNPLMAVLGNLQMALQDLDVLRRELPERAMLGEIEEELRDARDAAERVRAIVRDLKLFSRHEVEQPGEVDVRRVLESSLRMVWNEIRHRAVLERDLQDVCTVQAVESRLGQVLLNLIVNAAQAIPEGRANHNKIRVHTSMVPDGRVRVSVSDTGCGMSQETLSRIFTPFFTTKPVGVGTGLGLSICHQLISAIGGEIRVDSELGAGTTFHVLLPPYRATPTAAAPSPSSVARAHRRGKILVVDDEALVASTIGRLLGRDHDVTGITDSLEARRIFEAGMQFDLILCDLMMPNFTGMDLYAELAVKAPQQAARMVFMTGGAFTPQAQLFLAQTANPQLEKPIDLDRLRRVVTDCLRAVDR